jgi:hypothetical protein
MMTQSSGPLPRFIRPRRRRRPYPDGARHSPVDTPPFSCTLHVEQLLSDCAVNAWAVVLMRGPTGHIASRTAATSGRLLAVNYANRYVVYRADGYGS